uniref:(California timema) hypothetical protein n=1 Tax=Timema californicum TaxID=61474 RepID=A0A7R9PEC8_TIMCA|nr:unnamed protein product [Timema californicum]
MFKMSSIRDSSLVPKKEPQLAGPVTVYRIIEIPKGMFSSGAPRTYTALKEMVPQIVLDPSNVIEIQENAQGEFLTSKTPPNCAVLTADLLEKLSNKSYRKSKKSLGAHDKYPECYTCGVCSKSFKHNSHLRRHFNLHSQEKKYKCDLCNKTFLDISTLARHRRIHSGDKPWSCRLCSKSFGTLGSLRRHITVHNQECRPYHCDVCLKRFPDNSSFRKHVLIHTGTPIEKCTYILEKEKETEPKDDSLRTEKCSNQTTIETPVSDQSNENMQNRKCDKIQTHQSVLQYSKHIKQLLDILEDEVESDSGEIDEDEYITHNQSKYKNISIEKPTVELNVTTKQNNVGDSLNIDEEERNVTALQSVEKQNQVRTEEHIIVKGQTRINAHGKDKIEALQIVKENDHTHENKQPMVLEDVKMKKHLECDLEAKNQTKSQTSLQFNKKRIEPRSDMLIRQPSETLPAFQKGSQLEKQMYSKEQIRAISDSPANNKTGLQSDAQKKQNEPLQNQTTDQIEKQLNVQGDTQKSLSNFPTEAGAVAVEAQTKKRGSVNNMPDTPKSENNITMSEEVKSLVDEELEREKKIFFRNIKLDVNKPK